MSASWFAQVTPSQKDFCSMFPLWGQKSLRSKARSADHYCEASVEWSHEPKCSLKKSFFDYPLKLHCNYYQFAFTLTTRLSRHVSMFHKHSLRDGWMSTESSSKTNGRFLTFFAFSKCKLCNSCSPFCRQPLWLAYRRTHNFTSTVAL